MDVLKENPTHGQISVDRSAKTYSHQLCMDTGYPSEQYLGQKITKNLCQGKQVLPSLFNPLKILDLIFIKYLINQTFIHMGVGHKIDSGK